MSTPARPELRYESIQAMRDDVERLRKHGYDKAGQWDLPTMLDHIGKAMSGPFREGERVLPWPIGPIARRLVHRMVARQSYPRIKMPVPASIRPEPGVTMDDAYPMFLGACVECEKLSGDTVLCPPFGTISREDFIGMELLHAAHHLSFLKPKG